MIKVFCTDAHVLYSLYWCVILSMHVLCFLQQRRLRLSPEQATDFYAEHYGKMFFPSLIKYIHRWEKAAAKNGVEDYHEFY